jgi:putative ABC transport system permease protein
MKPVPGVSRTVGAAAGSMLALALLVCGCVFAALAGPALSEHTRTQALHQTLAGLSATTKTVQVGANWGDFTGPLVQNGVGNSQNITTGEFGQATREIGGGLAALGLPLAAGQWAGLSTNLFVVASGAGPRTQTGLPPKLEVLYRDPLTSNAQLMAGAYAGTAVPAGMLAVAATMQTAARFGLHPGSRLSVATPSGPVGLFVTAIVRERGPGSTFWTQDSTAGTPALQQLKATDIPFWVGGVFADPGQLIAMQNAFNGPGMELTWEFPLDPSKVTADQAQGLDNALNRATTTPPALTGPLTPSADTLTVTSPLISDLSLFLGTQAAIQTVLLLLFVSLIVVGAAVILLAARMIVARRDVELTMLRARGGSLRQVAALLARAAVLATGPAAVFGAALAIALIPGGAGSSSADGSGWPLAGIAVLAALAGPPLVAVWRYRRPVPASNPARITSAETRRPGRAWRRPVAEVTAIAASVAGLVVLRNQGVSASGGGGVDLYLTLTPVLVAIPVVVIMLRLYPLAVRGLLATSARRTGATGFVALSRAAQSSLTGVLPAFALVLALSLATFAGMVSNGITRGEITASWHTTGADVLIEAGPYSPPVSPATVRAIAAVRGVRHAAEVWSTNWVTPFGQPITVIAVDPASYAAVVAGTPFPAFPAAKIGTAAGGIMPFGATVPVLASPSAAAILGTGATKLTTLTAMGPFKVRVAGTLSGTPAQPGGGAFVVMPLQILPGPAGQPLPSTILVTGSAIDDAQLSAVAQKVFPGSLLTFRTTVLASLASSPLQHGAGLIIALTIVTAAAFGLFIVILGLALGSAERELTLARLTVMGHERATRLVLAEAMPAVLAAVLAGVVCAVALPHVVGSSIDLSAFTGTSAPVQFQPDVLALGLPAAVVVVLALAALTAEARAMRRRGITGILRAN